MKLFFHDTMETPSREYVNFALKLLNIVLSYAVVSQLSFDRFHPAASIPNAGQITHWLNNYGDYDQTLNIHFRC